MQIKTETRVGFFVLAAIIIFSYMAFQIGVIRFDRGQYKPYVVYFSDVSGLSSKADVKIAGVKVGWVEEIELVDNLQARAQIMIDQRFVLHTDSYAVVRQEGLLGNKYLEVIPGDPLAPAIASGQPLGKPSKDAVSVDELLQQFKTIATNVEQITDSLKETVGSQHGRQQLDDMMRNFSFAAEKIASFSDVLDRVLVHNEDNFNSMMGDFKEFAREMKENIPAMGSDIRRLSDKLEADVFPSFQTSMERIAEIFDRDFNRVASKLESTADSIEDAGWQVRDGFKNLSEVAGKINEGQGLLGKLVNEDDTYQDLKQAVQGVKNYLSKVEMLQIVFDAHSEFMHRPADMYRYEESKGYVEIRVHPNEDYFWLGQLVSTQVGNIKRTRKYRRWFNEEDCRKGDVVLEELIPQDQDLSDLGKLRFAQFKEVQKERRDTFRFGFQFGKIFGDVAFRFGLFDSTSGIGIDFDIPFQTDKFRWVTTFEMFDFRGRLHFDESDRRPHLKWLNRIFIMRNVYFTFGADDFISKQNANAFFGGGVRFGDEDIKYLLSRVNIVAGT